METIGNIVNAINSVIWSQYVLVPILLCTGLYFTIKTGFLQIRLLPEMIKSVSLNPQIDFDEKDSVSSFEAFTVGLASRVGTGNLAGVALAIVVGGPGSIFWMWIVAILGSCNAFIESTLAQLYKVKDPEVKFRGGPAYYMRDGIGSKKMGTVFAVVLVICFGFIFNALQANTISHATLNALNLTDSAVAAKWLIGISLAILSGVILFGGTKKIADFTSKMVPFMAILYLLIAAVVIIMRFDQIPTVFHMIVSDAFHVDAAFGATLGITMIQGVKRGLLSNEAGMGSAPNAAASATTDHPVRQGMIQSLGVYIDTLVICSATAFIILVSDVPVDQTATDGISVTMNALAGVVGHWSIYFLLIAIFFFAYSSILGCYYYAQSNVEYLSDNPKMVTYVKVALMFVIIFGAVADSEVVWSFSDLGMGIMTALNITAILLLRKQAFALLKDFETQLKAGKDPIFDGSKHEEFKHFELWDRSDLKLEEKN